MNQVKGMTETENKKINKEIKEKDDKENKNFFTSMRRNALSGPLPSDLTGHNKHRSTEREKKKTLTGTAIRLPVKRE